MIKVCSEAGPFPSLFWAETLTEMFEKLKHEVDDTSNTLLQTVSLHEVAGMVARPQIVLEVGSE